MSSVSPSETGPRQECGRSTGRRRLTLVSVPRPAATYGVLLRILLESPECLGCFVDHGGISHLLAMGVDPLTTAAARAVLPCTASMSWAADKVCERCRLLQGLYILQSHCLEYLFTAQMFARVA